ncbi:hypothetical protein N7489_003855 [Penicillium chrysogenum]|uniref:uncharacterized protein n=1 Tax=Penicillium chrysogenum TaxID=5076 RepID=UPI00239EB587|nr:uncharacterized protein N7489_003855 [Penicillium chrysogenum]KAJ5243759.1 hypothetical protein N7489_003855 [Penicillium chrysogenum]KAJ5286111.1 hypothetical protein N7524_001417 [Penicillium chrysogenum]
MEQQIFKHSNGDDTADNLIVIRLKRTKSPEVHPKRCGKGNPELFDFSTIDPQPLWPTTPLPVVDRRTHNPPTWVKDSPVV